MPEENLDVNTPETSAGNQNPEVVPKEHYENLKIALQQERAEKQELRQGLSQLQRTNELLEQMVTVPKEPDYDPSAYPETFADVERVTQKQIHQAMEQQLKPLVNNMQRQVYETQLASMRKEAQDFDEVIQLASEYIDRNPRMKQVLDASDNLPATMYEIGQLHPKYREKLISAARQETLKSIAEPQGTIAGRAGTPAVSKEADEIWSLSREEFNRKYGSRNR